MQTRWSKEGDFADALRNGTTDAQRLAALAEAAEAAKAAVEADVFAYLLGEGELDGKWHGEVAPEGKHPLWWRTHLRDTLTQLRTALGDA